jgi:hypothetical protein
LRIHRGVPPSSEAFGLPDRDDEPPLLGELAACGDSPPANRSGARSPFPSGESAPLDPTRGLPPELDPDRKPGDPDTPLSAGRVDENGENPGLAFARGDSPPSTMDGDRGEFPT